LGFSLLTAVAVACERIRSRPVAIVLHGLAIAILVAFGFAWPGWTPAVQVRRYAQLSIGFHLLVAFLPFLRGREPNGFWQFNRILFLRFCLSAVYSSVLFLGLVIALVAIDKLFKVSVAEVVYSRLWITIAFVFNTWFFLAGVPRDLPALEERRDYPPGLKVFAQFILLPLVVIYLAILTAYLGRILITGQWPSGWIGYLVSSVAGVGILSLLLVHPIREREENRWVRGYGRWFYIAMLPAIGMLLMAIGKRIEQYGITEDRYFMAVLSLWLAGIAVTFIVRRNTGIRVIPMTLCVIAFLTAFGPLGAYSVSRQSQVGRLRTLLERAEVQPGGAAKAAAPFAVRRDLSSTLEYLIGTHGERSLSGVLPDGLLATRPDTTRSGREIHGRAQQRASEIMTKLGMKYVSRWEGEQSNHFSYHGGAIATPMPVTGFDYHVRLLGAMPQRFEIAGEKWELAQSRQGRVLRLISGGTALEFAADTLAVLARTRGAPMDAGPRPRLETSAGGARATLVLLSYAGMRVRDSVWFQHLEGDLYLSAAPPRVR
ncbi:MAG TPA: DUF4153 domain-containing protein, partial [Candidatus Limnocylindria bacterium]|nr:DUF4153 domain-containing protein [Candidatus Limnocylindria bacterium]